VAQQVERHGEHGANCAAPTCRRDQQTRCG
jgi:hypothetical protein